MCWLRIDGKEIKRAVRACRMFVKQNRLMRKYNKDDTELENVD